MIGKEDVDKPVHGGGIQVISWFVSQQELRYGERKQYAHAFDAESLASGKLPHRCVDIVTLEQ